MSARRNIPNESYYIPPKKPAVPLTSHFSHQIDVDADSSQTMLLLVFLFIRHWMPSEYF